MSKTVPQDFVANDFHSSYMNSMWETYDHDGRLQAHCSNLMKQVAPSMFGERHGGCMSFQEQAADEVFLRPANEEEKEKPGLYLRFWPGNNVSQARALYRSLDVEALLALSRSEFWNIEPHLHLADSYCNVLDSNADITLLKYVEYWKAHQNLIKQHSKAEFANLFRQLSTDEQFSKKDEDEYKGEFEESDRRFVRLCPGLYMHFYFAPQEAARLEHSSSLVTKVRELIVEAFSTWGERPQFEKASAYTLRQSEVSDPNHSNGQIELPIENIGPLVRRISEIHSKGLPERNMEDAVKDFLLLLGYSTSQIEFQTGRIDVSLNGPNGNALAVFEVKRNLLDGHSFRDARRKAFDYAHNVGAQLVVLTDADLYEVYDAHKPGKYDDKKCGAFRLTRFDDSMKATLDLLRPNK